MIKIKKEGVYKHTEARGRMFSGKYVYSPECEEVNFWEEVFLEMKRYDKTLLEESFYFFEESISWYRKNMPAELEQSKEAVRTRTEKVIFVDEKGKENIGRIRVATDANSGGNYDQDN